MGGDFSGHIGTSSGAYDDVHGDFNFGDRNGGGASLLECAKAFDLVIANSCFPKKEEHLVTFQSTVTKTQIDYLLLRRCDRGLCMDCKVIPSENLTMQQGLLVMDLAITRTRKKKVVSGLPRIRCIRVGEVEGAMCKMSRGRVTGPDKIHVEFQKSAVKAGLE
nr:uncharacterized protein LOC104091257 [Nicotiana tomentosiformis]